MNQSRLGGSIVFLIVNGSIEAFEDDELRLDDSGADVETRSIASFLLDFRQPQIEQSVDGSGSRSPRFLIRQADSLCDGGSNRRGGNAA